MLLPKKKPWVTPTLKKLELTEELRSLFAEQAEAAPVSERGKHS